MYSCALNKSLVVARYLNSPRGFGYAMDYKDYEAGVSENSWQFVAKRELIDRLLKKYFGKRSGKILNVGAGTGEDMEVIGKYGDITVVEPDAGSIKMIKDRYKCIVKPIEKTNFDKKFDVALAFDVLEHIEDANHGTKAIWKALKPGGLLIGSVPARMSLWSQHDVELGHYRRYSRSMLLRHLKDFEPLFIGGWNVVLLPVIWTRYKIKKLLNKQTRETGIVPAPVNFVFKNILRSEIMCIRNGLSLPTGVSLVFVFRKR